MSKLFSVLFLLAACSSSPKATTHPMTQAHGLQIKLATIYVDDQEKALRFYTDVLGFVKKDDVTNGGYRWLTVHSPSEPEGSALLLALADSPATKAYQQALFEQHQPAVMFYTHDVDAEYARIKARGAKLTMPPTDVTMAKITMLEDTCGNLVQVTQLQ
jgi:predicted enzyme related to lactoylglutathione lyase